MMVFLQPWDYFIRILSFSVIFNLSGIFGTVIQWRPEKEKLLREFLMHEVTIPRVQHGQRHVTSTKTQTGHLGAITLTLEAFNMSLVVDLQLNRNLFASSYIEKHFGEDGREIFINTSNHHHSHCYYHGRLRRDPESTVAISTCHGIRGTIFSALGTFHIEPTDSVINGRHFIFNDVHQRPKNLTCGHEHEIFTGFSQQYKRPARLKRSTIEGWPYDSSSKTRVVEMYVVNDKTEYDEYEKDLSQVIGRTKDIINIVSSLYRPIHVYIALVGIEVWTDKDLIEVKDNPDLTMNNFLTYRRNSIKHPNDNAQLITGKQLGSGVVGKAPIMTICSWQYSGGVNNDHNLVVGPVATTVAHELGHNFGLSHDTDKCGCPDDRCIMAASSGGINNPTKWSQCSKHQFQDAFDQGMDYCLTNLPAAIDGPSTCGNGFLETGEECDCGLSQDCNTACCDPFTCKLTENATCATGACCDLDTCKPKKAASLCRPSAGACDLPETCNGRTEFCPLDYHVVDGSYCSTPFGDSYCYAGKCSTHDSQCQLLWGKTGQKSNDGCYQHFNTMGEASGHCGFNWIGTQFTPCKPEDVKCGMLHCTHRNEKLMFWKEALAYTMPEGYVTISKNNQHIRQDCMGAILDVGLYMRDPGMVPNGAMCDVGKICVEQHCTSLEDLDVKVCPDCHGHGTCNNVGLCHCDNGYGPPYCNQPGNGGSTLSGPMEINNNNVGLIVGLCFFFLIILPLLVVAGYYGYKHRENLKKILLEGPTEGYRKSRLSSIYRAKPRNDIVNHGDKSAAVITRNPSVVSNHMNNTTAAAPVHSYTSNHRTNNIKRASSFRPQDISTPQLESSTKSLTGIPTLRHSVCGVPGAGPPAHTPMRRPVASRQAPPPPGGWSRRKVPNNGDSNNGPPGRPPAPKDGFKCPNKNPHSPRAAHPLPPTPSQFENHPEVERPTKLGLRGGCSDQHYVNVDEADLGTPSPVFSDVALDSPQVDEDLTSPNQVHAYVNHSNGPIHARYNTNNALYRRDQNDYHGSRNSDNVDRKPSNVKDARKLFEGSNHGRNLNRSDNMARNKYPVENRSAHAAARTNKAAASNQNKNPSGPVSRSASDPKPPVSRKPLVKTTSHHNPGSKPSPNPKPQGVALSGTKQNKDSIC